jgi:uncharacterized SAM-binding protein YcdF (DUF218 family)
MIKKLFKLLLWLVVAALLWLSYTGIAIWSYGNKDHAALSDSIIVLGAAIVGDKPSPVFEERINHAVNLFQNTKAPRIIFTGGLGNGEKFTESEVGAAFAVGLGVPSSAILKDMTSRTTRQNLLEAQSLMKAHNLKSVIIVSDPLHLKRAEMMARDLGISAVTSPTPTSRYRSLNTKLEFLFREIYFYNHYLLFNF